MVSSRRIIATVGGALLIVLAGCGGQEAGPTAKPAAQDPGPDALPIKLNALTADECFLSPDRQLPQGCEKYVTELGNTANSVRARDSRLAGEADRLDKAVSAFRGNSCGSVPTPGGPCTQALTDIAASLSSIKIAVNKQATTG